MRTFLIAAAAVGLAQCAHAADMPDFLRGPIVPTYRSAPNWEGFYVGGHASYGSSDMHFGSSTQSLVEGLLNHTAFETNRDTSGKSENDTRVSRWRYLRDTTAQNYGYGGYVGYNAQWEDTVYGIELNYTHGTFSGASRGSKGIFDSDVAKDYTTFITSSGSSSMQVTDFGSLRLRAGYAMGNFLPYAFIGGAMGQANIARSVTVTASYTPSSTTSDLPAIPDYRGSLSDNGGSHFIYGYSAGIGFDMMVTANVFLRGEYEYLRFTAPIDTTINAVRAGVGYKF